MSGLRKSWRSSDQFLVRHKDSSIVVVEKKAGLLTVRTPSNKGANLLELIDRFLEPKRRRRGVFAVHRLDRPVSGLLVFARTPVAKDRLTEQFAEHTVERRYVAAVDGVLPDDEGTFESWLRSDPHTLRMFSDEGTDGKHAVTHWRVSQRYKHSTLVEVQLETGLRNQIRVHFAEAGFPLLGERKYLDKDHPDHSSIQGHIRIFLHAAVLGFNHPLTREPMRFEAEVPSDLKRMQSKLR